MSLLRFETVERSSLFTKLDFRTKFFIIVFVMMVALLWESIVTNLFLAVTLIFFCLIAGVKSNYIISIIKLLLPFWLIMILVHGFFSEALVLRLSQKDAITPLFSFPHSWWLIGGGAFSLEGTLFGLSVAFKTFAMILTLPLAIFTSGIDNMVVGMVRMKIPYKIAFIFSSTMRFFPLLSEEIQLIIEAQRLRGLAMEKMNLIKKTKVYSRIGIPLILNAMTNSQQIDVVLQSKGFNGSSERTYLYDSDLKTADWIIILSLIILFFIAIILYFSMDVGKFSWLLFK